MKKLFLSGVAVNILVIGINFLTGILSARYLGPYGRGELATANRWTGLLVLLFTLGLPGAVIYLGKQYPDCQDKYFGAYLFLGSSVSMVGLGLSELAIPHILSSQSLNAIRLVQISLLTLPFGVLTDGLVGTLQTLNMFGRVLLLRVLSPLGTILIITSLIAIDAYTVLNFLICNIIWGISTFALVIFWLWRTCRPRISNLTLYSKALLGKGLQIYAGSLVSMFGGNLDQLLISVLLSPYALGLYAVAGSIGTMLPSVIIGALGVFLWPKLMELSSLERQRKVALIHSLFLYGTALLATVTALVLPWALPLLYGTKFNSSIMLAEILLIGAPLNVAYVILTSYLSTESKFKNVTVAEIIGVGAAILVTFLLLHRMEAMGAALGLVAANSVKWIYLVNITGKMGISMHDMFVPKPRVFIGIVIGMVKRKERAETAI